MGKLENMLIKHEGRKLKPYRDTENKLTIGVGRNIEDIGITKEESDYLLQNDIKRVTLELNKALPWFILLDESRQFALIDMSFMGVARLMLFKNFLDAMSKKDWQRAHDEMLDSKWARQVGDRATDLASIILTGIIPASFS